MTGDKKTEQYFLYGCTILFYVFIAKESDS